MRISDWSSDVCSSDLLAAQIYGEPPANGYVYGGSGGGRRSPGCMEYGTGVYTGALPYHSGGNVEPYGTKSRVRSEQPVHFGLMFNVQRLLGDRIGAVVRSEEHTSELQSLMRISYAVFCLKKKNCTVCLRN